MVILIVELLLLIRDCTGFFEILAYIYFSCLATTLVARYTRQLSFLSESVALISSPIIIRKPQCLLHHRLHLKLLSQTYLHLPYAIISISSFGDTILPLPLPHQEIPTMTMQTHVSLEISIWGLGATPPPYVKLLYIEVLELFFISWALWSHSSCRGCK